MSRKINYRKSKENGWSFTSKIYNDEPTVYYMSSGHYTTDPLSCKGRIKAVFYLFNQFFIRNDKTKCDSFYCKEDVVDFIEDNKRYFVTDIDGRDVNFYLSDKKTILSSLLTREESLSNFVECHCSNEEDRVFFNKLLTECNNNLSLTCYRYCDKKGQFEGPCFCIKYIPPLSFKRTKNN